MNSYPSLGTLEELILHLGLSIVFLRILLANICATLPNDGPVDHLSDVSPLKRTHDGDPSEFGLPFKKRRTGIHTGSALVNTMPDIFGRTTLSQQRVSPRNSARPCQKTTQRSTPFPSRKFTL
jgi:hypothetical protein